MERSDLEMRVYEACRRCPYGADLIVTVFIQALHSYRKSSVCIVEHHFVHFMLIKANTLICDHQKQSSAVIIIILFPVCTPFPTALFHTAGDANEKDYQGAENAVQDFPKLNLISSSDPPRTVGSDGISNSSNPVQDMPLKSLNLLYWLLHPRYQLELVHDPAEELSIVLPSTGEKGCQENGFNIASSPDCIVQVRKVGPKTGGDSQTEFEAIKASSGSMFAFHGTSAENLHSILRCGLLNLSNTTLQRNGAIFGEGTYLSTDINVALGFSRARGGWKDSCFGKTLKYLLVCEIAKGEKVFYTSNSGQSLIKASSNSSLRPAQGSYIIVQNSDLIMIRYIFVYTEHIVQYENKVGVTTENSNTIGYKRFLGRNDWCRILILFYVGLLLAIAYIKSVGTHNGRHVSIG